MQRNTFLRLSLGAGALLCAPFVSLARIIDRKRVGNGLVVKAGKDRNEKPLSLFEGDTFCTKVSAKDSDGDIYVFESTRIKEGGPTYHLHYAQDEYWYVLQGEFLFKVGEETFTAKAGDSVFGPRMVPHAFSKVGEGDARLLMFFQPAGKMEALFQLISEGKAKNLTEEERAKLNHEHGIKSVGPPLKYQKKW
jgi:mannose-6-phosphate isomerase-like protein (cupin superfamily)